MYFTKQADSGAMGEMRQFPVGTADDLKYGKALRRESDGLVIDPQVQSPCLRPIASVFKENADRVYSLASMPVGVSHWLGALQSCASIAAFTVTGNPELPDDVTTEVEDKVRMEIVKEFEAYQKQIADSRAFDLAWEHALDNVIMLIQGSDHRMRRSIETLLSSQIAFAWTTFETLAGDLWVASLNAHPDTLAMLCGKAIRIWNISNAKIPPKNDDNSKRERDKMVSLNALHHRTHGKYNVAEIMGTILKDRYGFDSLGGIRSAYGEAFSKNFEAIDIELANKSLDALSIVRNVIVHRSGVADEEYVERRMSVAEAPDVQLGQPVPITGELFRSLSDPVMMCANRLLKAVDQWLLTN